MAINTKGTKIPARLASDDEFPYIEDTDQLGGFQIVTTIADRNNILQSKRKPCMQVYVQATNLIYELSIDLTTWSEGKKLSKNDYSDTDKTLLSTFNASNVIDKHFFDKSFCVSSLKTEVYAHQAYNVISGQYMYTVYMANDGLYDASGNLITGSVEGDTGQIIRMSKSHLTDRNDITFYTVATATSSWPTPNDLTLKFRPQSPNILLIDKNTVRIFFVALTNYSSNGDQTLCYIDFTISTSTFGAGNRCRMYFKGSTNWQYANLQLIYDHFDWCNAGRPASDVSYPSNSLQYTVQDIHIATDFYKAFNTYIYTIINVGSGADKNQGSIFMRTQDNGANWQLFCSFNPLQLPGVTGVDRKGAWEGCVMETSTEYIVFQRGAPDPSPAKGTWRFAIPKTDLYSVGTPTKISDLNNEKINMFKANGKYYIILPEDNRYQGPNYGVRTLHGIYLCNADFTTLTRVLGVVNSNGAHTFAATYLSDMIILVYTSSDLRLSQNRGGTPSWQNTSNINCLQMSYVHLF